MRYREFPKDSQRVSALGMGCMRLPTKDGAIDRPEAVSLIRRAIEGGVNYVDTAYGYHGGESERLVGEALRGRLPGARAAGHQIARLAGQGAGGHGKALCRAAAKAAHGPCGRLSSPRAGRGAL